MMINTFETAFNQCPKTINSVGVNIPIHVDFRIMVDYFMVITHSIKLVVARHFIGVNCGIW